jgi:NADH dehydrogenase FAD-containing subunit
VPRVYSIRPLSRKRHISPDTWHGPLSESSRVRIEPTLQLHGAPEAFVIGDAAYLEAAGI